MNWHWTSARGAIETTHLVFCSISQAIVFTMIKAILFLSKINKKLFQLQCNIKINFSMDLREKIVVDSVYSRPR